jgi:AcrR family transcriptional regulator
MQDLLSRIEIILNDSIYLKDPNSSELGKRIVSSGIDLIAELGFEHFTIKKLGKHISSPEASIYRYFESKQKLLLYITSWYWGWMEYQIVFSHANISSPEERLKKSIEMLTSKLPKLAGYPHISSENLYTILVTESSKSYLHKKVDDENNNGVFLGYKRIVARISEVILEINPKFMYPHMLISTIIEGAHHQRFFAEHLPKLTDTIDGKDAIQDFYSELVFKAIK